METPSAPESASRYQSTAWLFAVGLSLLISHELDAMIRNEWELLPGLNRLDPDIVPDVFNLLHVPLVAAVVWLLISGDLRTRRRTMISSEVLFVVHAVAHTLLRGDQRYQFQPPVETITVYGSAIVSAAHLLVAWFDRRMRLDEG